MLQLSRVDYEYMLIDDLFMMIEGFNRRERIENNLFGRLAIIMRRSSFGGVEPVEIIWPEFKIPAVKPKAIDKEKILKTVELYKKL